MYILVISYVFESTVDMRRTSGGVGIAIKEKISRNLYMIEYEVRNLQFYFTIYFPDLLNDYAWYVQGGRSKNSDRYNNTRVRIYHSVMLCVCWSQTLKIVSLLCYRQIFVQLKYPLALERSAVHFGHVHSQVKKRNLTVGAKKGCREKFLTHLKSKYSITHRKQKSPDNVLFYSNFYVSLA